MKVKFISLVIAVIVSTSLVGCGQASQNSAPELEAMYLANTKEAPIEANPEQAVAAIYNSIEKDEGEVNATEIAESDFQSVTGITEKEYIEVVAFGSQAKEGLTNVFIVKPYPSLRENVRSKLLTYRENKVREFENFDILNAYSISKNAVVYDQGEYLVMLMLKDNETAQAEVDKYIPQ